MGHMNARIERLTAELAALTGKPPEEALLHALEEQVSHLKATPPPQAPSEAEILRRREVIRQAQEAFARLPVLDNRSADEILGYNEFGTFD